MYKLLITGVSGFVGRHFLNYLLEKEDEVEVKGIDIKSPSYDVTKYKEKLIFEFEIVDLLDTEKCRDIVKKFQPDYVLHLAAYSSVAYSWKFPAESFANNTNIFLNLLMAIKEFAPKCKVLSVGSSEEYGNVAESQLPLKEDMPLNPVSPYAVARVSQEMLSKVFVKNYGMNIVITRSFNHIGPYQDNRFVVPSFIKQAVSLKKQNLSIGILETGNVSIVRDFVDVRDVVDAYYKLLVDGEAGELYNICSGKGRTLSELIDKIAEILDMTLEFQINQEYVRPDDNPIIIGDPGKIEKQLGWKRRYSMEQTLSDMIRTEYEE